MERVGVGKKNMNKTYSLKNLKGEQIALDVQDFLCFPYIFLKFFS